jgi:hypothetical protein
MTRYLITYTYTGDIQEEVEADSLEQALEQAEHPGYKYTVVAGGIEIDLYQTGRPRMTVKSAVKTGA